MAVQSQRQQQSQIFSTVQGRAVRDPARIQKNARGSSTLNSDLDDLEYTGTEVGQVPKTSKTGRPPVGKPPKTSDVRKSQETGSILAKLKNEAERSKNFLEKQALAE